MAAILIVDDEPGVRSALGEVLRDEGYTVEAVESGEACLERLVEQEFDVVLLDVWMPGIDGLETLQRLRERKVDSQVVVISGHGNVESAVRAIAPEGNGHKRPAALLLSRHPELIGRPGEIKRILQRSAIDLGRERYFQGAGLLDILAALELSLIHI